MKEFKTVSELAKDIGCSRQAVYQRIRSDKQLSSSLQPFTVKQGKVTAYSLQGQKLIISAFSERVVKQVDNNLQSIDSNQSVNLSIDKLTAQIDELKADKKFLQEQIIIKDKQLERLSDQLSDTLTALKAAQALHGMERQQPKELEVIPAAQPAPAQVKPRSERRQQPAQKRTGTLDRLLNVFRKR